MKQTNKTETLVRTRNPKPDRKTILLCAVYELLKKQDESHIVLELTAETVVYDEAECDGFCLMEDIKHELGL